MTNAEWFHSFSDAEDALYAAMDHDFSKLVNLPLPVLTRVLDALQAHYGRIR